MIHQQQQEELQLRHRAELRSKDERWEAQRLTWEENLIRSQEAEMMAKERELRTRLREERDKVSLSVFPSACQCVPITNACLSPTINDVSSLFSH